MELNEEQFKKLIVEVKSTVDDRFKAFNDGLKSAKEHDQPAPRTTEFILKTEKTMTGFAEDIGTIKDILKTVPSKVEMELMITNAICLSLKECDKKYASKTTENIVNGTVAFILLAFLGTVVALVIK
jgi:hypothetical protein